MTSCCALSKRSCSRHISAFNPYQSCSEVHDKTELGMALESRAHSIEGERRVTTPKVLPLTSLLGVFLHDPWIAQGIVRVTELGMETS